MNKNEFIPDWFNFHTEPSFEDHINDDGDGKIQTLVKYKFEDQEHWTYEHDKMLGVLLLAEQIIVNSYWWHKGLSDDMQNRASLSAMCSDVFAWACADAEPIDYSDIPDLFDHWRKDADWGVAVWCIKKRQQMPQKPVYDSIMRAGIWNLDEIEKKFTNVE